MRAAALASVLVLGGCAQRLQLTDDVLEHAAENYELLRVLPSRRLVVFEPPAEKVVIRRSFNGAIVGDGPVGEGPRLFVTFDPDCDSRECAYLFVRIEDGRYRFAAPPEDARATRRSTNAILELKKRRIIRG